jgi:prepilin peptidase CpaA
MLWALGVPFAFVLIAAVCDLRKRIIPDWVSILLGVWAVAALVLGLQEAGWLSVLGGCVVAFLLGLLLFALGGLGGGDVKLLTALGAALGFLNFFGLLFWVALAGGGLALVAKLRKQREFAYVPAIALGYVLFLLWQLGSAYASATP